MTRISSAMIPMAAMSDIGKAQQELVEAARQSSAQTKANDLKGYGREAQTLVSAQRLMARMDGFQATTRELNTRMEIQDVALGRSADAVSKLKQDLFQNIGIKSGEGIRAQLDEAFSVLKDAMNTNLGGRYLFGGVMNDRAPITATSLSDLAAQPLTNVIEQGAERIHFVRIVRLADHERVPLAFWAAGAFRIIFLETLDDAFCTFARHFDRRKARRQMVQNAVVQGQRVADARDDRAACMGVSSLFVGHADGPIKHGISVAIRWIKEIKHLFCKI